MTRSYPRPDVELLWGRAAGLCSFPNCKAECTAPATDKDKAVPLGDIAHIEAHKDDGPRGNSALTAKQRDCYANWILLCGNHHDQVDKQANTDTVDDLRKWKNDHEEWVRNSLASEMPQIGFAELEIITNAMTETIIAASIDFQVIDPREKMKKNDLTDNTHFLLTIGLGKAPEVKSFVDQISKINSRFPEKLRTGFVAEYKRLKQKGYNGDALFEAMADFASKGKKELKYRAAGLSVLAYLFHLCEVFEK